MPAYICAYGYWLSLYKEAAARNISIDDDRGMDIVMGTVMNYILSNSAITENSIIHRYRTGENPNGEDDDEGLIIAIGLGINKTLDKCLTDEERAGVEKAMREVMLGPPAELHWFRLRRLK
ncbi:hypothetical protein FRC08_003689 [Ceratobasidium sp. 394]|nr:hypothetical protein FRC08_003689 [Ceratobasidium sp. 394]KAG9085397.1 hypothetical protein FS749_004452 [Ceratobasidium sp. UAMH 11750]